MGSNIKLKEATELASLLSILESVSLNNVEIDKRKWSIHSSTVFSSKSFSDAITYDPSVPIFDSHKLLWSTNVP